jgi:dGTPase
MEDAAIWNERRLTGEFRRELDPRAAEDHDLARVIHSGSFRRLQSKTQVLGLGESDFYRTRLTHSVEVAQIATGIKRHLERPDDPCVAFDYLPGLPTLTAISLAHDIGHPPFGHGGEVALNYMMRGRGGFEGNAQTLRILSRLEKKTKNHGLNLTRRSMLGVLKYPAPFRSVASRYQLDEQHAGDNQSFRTVDASKWKSPKCYYDEDQDLVDWILEPFSDRDRSLLKIAAEPATDEKAAPLVHKSLDTSIMDISDDISYGVHDLEDAIHMKFIRDCRDDRETLNAAFSKLDKEWLVHWSLDSIVKDLFGEKWDRKDAISRLIHCLICSTSVKSIDEFEHPLLRFRLELSPEAHELTVNLQDIVRRKVIFCPEVQTLEYSGQLLVMELFEAMSSSPTRLLPADTQKLLNDEGRSVERLVCDHISGMTDDYAAKMYGRLFSPRTGSIFEKL